MSKKNSYKLAENLNIGDVFLLNKDIGYVEIKELLGCSFYRPTITFAVEDIIKKSYQEVTMSFTKKVKIQPVV